MSVKVRLRLPVPEGKPGDVVELSQERAATLVDRRYATFVSGGSSAPEPAAPAEEPAGESTAGAPVVELPGLNDKKADWVAAAGALGIETEGLTKEEIIEVVTEVTGG